MTTGYARTHPNAQDLDEKRSDVLLTLTGAYPLSGADEQAALLEALVHAVIYVGDCVRHQTSRSGG